MLKDTAFKRPSHWDWLIRWGWQEKGGPKQFRKVQLRKGARVELLKDGELRTWVGS